MTKRVKEVEQFVKLKECICWNQHFNDYIIIMTEVLRMI